MKIHTSDYIKSAPSLKECPDFGPIPEVALVGRSNVGKSSFINSMLQRKNLARTSNTPGKTRYINFYKITYTNPKQNWPTPRNLVFVDLPGYGYAKVSHAEQERWRRDLESYLSKRDALKAVVLLMDARHGPLESDIRMFEYLQHHGKRVFLLMTKSDKLSKNELGRHTQSAARSLDIRPSDMLFYSAETHLNRESVWAQLQHWLDTSVNQPVINSLGTDVDSVSDEVSKPMTLPESFIDGM